MSVIIQIAVILTVIFATPLFAPWWLILLVWWMALWAMPDLNGG